ncbi:phosphatase PAP2 family protein [Streptomyces sp. NBC_01216]|uniref:phosphatase PAP2 family protein n=1 Tax=unclassified Streptomyces TaxID=2593676 RepID=UPI002E11E0F5|nr:phosphatase PAP2 family protein [Streptomyces sp. NBC_01216]
MAPYDRPRTDGFPSTPATGTWWYAAVAGEAAGSFSARVRNRMRAACLGSVALLAVLYAWLVLTATGQRWENAALAGRLADGPLAAARSAHPGLRRLTLASLAVGVLVVALIGVLRQRYALTLVALGTVTGSLLLTEVLQLYVLGRPDLIEALPHLLGNTFPSGHTTIAVSVLFGLLVVVPHRMRLPAAGIGALWVTAVGAYTLAAGWHRPGDVLGADLLVLAVGCGLAGMLARRGRVAPTPRARHPLRTLLVTGPTALLAIAGLGVGLALLLGTMFGTAPGDPSLPRLAYLAGQGIAAGAGAAVTLSVLALLRHVDLDGRPVPYRWTGPFTEEPDQEIS